MSTFYKILLIFLAVVVYLKVKNWARWRYLRKWGETEGCGDVPTVPNILPWGLERFAILFTGLEGRDLLEDIVRPRFTEYGYTHRMHNVLRTIVATADPENIQAVLATKFQDFDLGPVRRKNFADVIGNGIFSSDGESWIHYRSQLKPQFTRDQVSDLNAAERHLQIFYKAIPEDGATGWTEKVDLSPLLFRFTMDVSTEFLFGKSTNTQTRALSPDNSSSKDLKQDMDFAEAMTFAQEYIFYRSRFAGLYWLANSKKFQRACKTLKDFTADFVNVVLDPNNKRTAAGMGQKEKFILLDALVEETRDPTELRDQLLHVLLAGRDTTASLLSWIILLLSRYPTEFLKVRQAVLSQFGSTNIPTQEMTFTTLKQCKPIIYFLYETLRLYPLVPMNGRRAVRNTTLPTGGGRSGKQPIAIMKGEQVGFHSYALHRRHDIWGDDADEFKPERWEGRKLGWEYIPFSGGPRICLGQQYALNEASFVLAKLVQKYDKIEPIEPITDLAAPIKKRFTLVMFPADGVKVRLHKASD